MIIPPPYNDDYGRKLVKDARERLKDEYGHYPIPDEKAKKKIDYTFPIVLLVIILSVIALIIGFIL